MTGSIPLDPPLTLVGPATNKGVYLQEKTCWKTPNKCGSWCVFFKLFQHYPGESMYVTVFCGHIPMSHTVVRKETLP